ncbi:MAG TPA: sigma-70 family RNA polymerase sigma factor [Baekduia sp.]|nr:sigma-70 family RNA polymerase sigma factor [Baekduia sp.]
MPTHAEAITGSAAAHDFEVHRRALTGYCYRMLGSWFEAEDAVQETMVRAWRSADRLQAPEAMRSWLYRIATNVCLDALQSAKRRARPVDLGPASTADSVLDDGRPEAEWLEPAPDARVMPTGGDPAELAAARETLRLAFVAALQHLPPRQRAVLILREVLRWQASEVAELLDTSVASVNSALQRARATLDALDLDADRTSTSLDEDHQALFVQYVDAFERYDIAALVKLLRDDVEFSMPPYELWLEGPEQVAAWMLGKGAGCQGSRLLLTSANGCPAYGQYRPDPAGGHTPWALGVVRIEGGAITGITSFLDTKLFAAFGLPSHLDDGEPAPEGIAEVGAAAA